MRFGEIARLGGAGCEHDLVIVGVGQSCNSRPCVLDRARRHRRSDGVSASGPKLGASVSGASSSPAWMAPRFAAPFRKQYTQFDRLVSFGNARSQLWNPSSLAADFGRSLTSRYVGSRVHSPCRASSYVWNSLRHREPGHVPDGVAEQLAAGQVGRSLARDGTPERPERGRAERVSGSAWVIGCLSLLVPATGAPFRGSKSPGSAGRQVSGRRAEGRPTLRRKAQSETPVAENRGFPPSRE